MKNFKVYTNTSDLSDYLEQDGFIILVDKEEEWTSFDVVKKLRNALRIKKVGHAGTLDPFATGLLVVLFGKATKSADHHTSKNKVYQCTVKLGAATNSYDLTGQITDTSDIIPGKDKIILIVNSFKGEQYQIPPMFSAIKINGQRLYKAARKGKEVQREPRKITIHSIEILDIRDDELELRIECSKGTYIRSIAHDIGIKLGCFAHLTELRRIRSGDFDVEDAVKVSDIVEKFNTSENFKI